MLGRFFWVNFFYNHYLNILVIHFEHVFYIFKMNMMVPLQNQKLREFLRHHLAKKHALWKAMYMKYINGSY